MTQNPKCEHCEDLQRRLEIAYADIVALDDTVRELDAEIERLNRELDFDDD